MDARISVNGRITVPEEACVPVLDRGFLYGDSVYEVFWWHRGTLIQADDHFERLAASAERIYLPDMPPRAALEAAIARTCEAAGATPEDDAYVRLMVTRGSGPIGLGVRDAAAPCVVVVVTPARRLDDADFERGLHMALVARQRTASAALDPRAKTGNYLNNVLALHEAQLAGADDAIMLNERGRVAEATTSNVYLVQGGAVVTPPLAAGILEGTSRRRILALCRALDLPAREASVAPEDVRRADEVFVSSSVRGIVPVTRVDGDPVGPGTPGPVTRRLHAAFRQAAAEEAGRHGSA